MKIILIIFLAVINCSEKFKDLKFIHQYKNSISVPFFYPVDSNTIPSFSTLGDVSFIKSEESLRLSSQKSNSEGAIWSENSLSERDWRVVLNFRMHSNNPTGGDGMAVWFTKSPHELGEVLGCDSSFNGVGVLLKSHPSTMVKLVEHDGRSEYIDEEHTIISKSYDFNSFLRSVFLRLTYFNGKLTAEIDRDSYGQNFVELFSQEVKIPKNFYLGVTASSLNNPQNHDLSKLDFYQCVKGKNEEVHVESGDLGNHDEIQSHLEELRHRKEEKQHYDPMKSDAVIVSLLEKIEDFQEKVLEYLNNAIGVAKQGKTISQRLVDVESRLKTFTDHVNLLTTALNKLTGLQTGEKSTVQDVLKDFRDETDKRLNVIESHTIDSSNKSKNIHEVIESSKSFGNVLFYGVIFLTQLIILMIYINYKKGGENSRKFL